jgi:DNA-binding NtrC family response regulator
LLVEDNKSLLNAWRRMLTEEGAAVHVARSAHEARYKLELLDSVLTCCVLDVHLPDEQGFGLAQWTRHRLPRVGVVVASGWSEFDLDEAAHKLRAAALSKPFSHRSTIDAILAATEMGNQRAAE